MTESKNHIYKWLLPLAFIYGWGVRLRNKLLTGMVRSRILAFLYSASEPAVGGTGKHHIPNTDQTAA